MLFFGHLGITAGVSKACDILLSMTKPGGSYQLSDNIGSRLVISRERSDLRHVISRIQAGIGLIDYRLVLLGSLLPDIIDKPVFLLIGDSASLSGRDYAHTLLFNLALFVSGMVLFRYRKPGLLIISFSSFMHLVLDQMWGSSVILLWPLMGPLPHGETSGWLADRFQGLFLYPQVYIPEIIGLLVIFFFTYRVTKKKGITDFLKEGVIG